MKRTIIFSVLLTGFCATAQVKMQRLKGQSGLRAKSSATVAPSSQYSFLTYTAPYQPITGTSLTQGLKWDEADFAIPLGFNFRLYGKQNDTIRLFGGSSLSFDDINNANAIAAGSPMYEDLCDRAWDPSSSNEGDAGGISNISYTVTGATGSRICKVQVSNAGFYGEIDSASVSTSVANFQVWLYETSNVIEFRYGTVDIQHPFVCLSNGAAGFVCGLANVTSLFPTAGTGNLLTGAPNNPTMVGFDTNNPFTDAVGMLVQSGRVYQFNNTSFVATGIAQNAAIENLRVFPNPASSLLYIQGVAAGVETAALYDMTGRQVYAQQGAGAIDVSALNSGLYQLVLKGNNGVVQQSKVLVSH